MATSAKTEHTARSIQSLDNDQLLKLFAIVVRDVNRRTRIYGDAREPAALLDGIKFAARAKRIHADGFAGYTSPNVRERQGCLAWKWGIGAARDTLTKLLTETSFDDVVDGVDLDG
jgi:hypothetical protein